MVTPLNEQETFDEIAPQVEINDPVAGGASGPVNQLVRPVANRTRWLKKQYSLLDTRIAELETKIGDGSMDDVLKKAENLADIPDKETARTNLGVPPTNHNHDDYIKKTKNLADVENVDAARKNLGVADIHFVKNPPAAELGKDGDVAIQEISNATPVIYKKQNGVWTPVITAQNTEMPGVVKWFAGKAVPGGYLKCNGQAVSRSEYAALFAAIGTTYGLGDGYNTFNLPDIRGNVIRGHDDGRGIDPSRAFGSEQDSQNKSHHHGLGTGTTNSAGTHGHIGSTSPAGKHAHRFKQYQSYDDNSEWAPGNWELRSTSYWATEQDGEHSHPVTISEAGGHGHALSGDTDYEGGAEARMRNIAMMAIIKY